MKPKFIRCATTCYIVIVLLAACEKDNTTGTDHERINSVMLRLEHVLTGTKLQYYVRDLDGEGGDPPIVDEILLEQGQEYRFEIEVFYDADFNVPPTDVTYEIMEDPEWHLVCYETTGATPQPSIMDTDNNGKPLGLEGEFTASATGSGSLRVTLKHLPDKFSADPCKTGKIDIDVTFEVQIN